MATSWKDYQEEAAALFRSIGFDAATDVRLKGVRTVHDIDVVVRSHHAGFDVTWLVECKHWKAPVSKLHVLALREIVAELGADRGILLCEAGFQSGAVEAANLTNVRVTSLEHIRISAENDISAMRLRELYDRLETCKTKYWDLSKQARIQHGLRGDVGEFAYSGARVLELCEDLIARALRGTYPFRPDSVSSIIELGEDKQFTSSHEVVLLVTGMIEELERRLAKAVG